MGTMSELSGVEVRAPRDEPRQEEILTPQALAFVADLQRTFGGRRDELMAARAERRTTISRTGTLDFLDETKDVREAEWTVTPAPVALQDRRVEITGPTDAKMAINALNSGAKVWLADLEDANTPHWENVIGGQVSLYDAHRHQLTFTSAEGKEYALNDGDLAVPVVRPRGWHLPEKHVLVDGNPMVGALLDFGLHFFHNAEELLQRGLGPYYYLPKMESHLEARLWNDVFTHAQDVLGVPFGSIRATVLIETITAAFEMDEILFELQEHASGLNAGRWDYLFSVIKNFRDAGDSFVLPDRSAVGMTQPFMRAYSELLVATCHRRGAFAMGGMAAFIPSRRDEEVNAAALAKVHEDKKREAGDGYDGSWVAHPDLVPICREEFDAVLGDRPNQLSRQRDDVSVSAGDLLDVASTEGVITGQRCSRQRVRGSALHRLVAARDRRRRARQPDGGRRDGRDLTQPALAVDARRQQHRRRHRDQRRLRPHDRRGGLLRADDQLGRPARDDRGPRPGSRALRDGGSR